MLASKKPGQTTDASLLVSGTLSDARLSSNVALENVANVFSAKQSFSGVDHVGLCLLSLTSAQYNALTPANGDLFRDSTTDRIDARLARGTVELVDTAGGQTINGALGVTGNITLASGVVINSGSAGVGVLTINNDGNSRWVYNGAEFIVAGAIRPSTTNARTLGTSGQRWSTVFGVNGDFTGNLTASGSVFAAGSTNVYSFSSTHPLSASPNTSWRFGSGWAGNYDTQFIFAYADNAAKVLIDTSGSITAFGGYYVNVPASSSNNIRPLQHGNSFLRFSAPASGIPGNNTTLEGWDSVFLNASTGNVRLRIGGVDRLVLTNTDLTLTGNLTASGTVNANSIQLSGVDLYAALMTNLRSIDMEWTTGVVTGSASTGPQGSTISTNRIDNQTGTTAGSTFVRSLGIWGGTDNAAFHETLTYSRPISFLCSLYRTSTSTNSIARFLLANQNAATALAAPGFGFEIRNERIWIVAHDGTTLTQLDTSINWYTGAVNLMRCESNGSGTISLFRGSTLLGTISGAPTGTFPGFISVSGTNGSDSSSLRFQYNRLMTIRV